jgi:hypothetical protein
MHVLTSKCAYGGIPDSLYGYSKHLRVKQLTGLEWPSRAPSRVMIGAVLNPPFSPFEDTIQLPSGLQLNLRKKEVEASLINDAHEWINEIPTVPGVSLSII